MLISYKCKFHVNKLPMLIPSVREYALSRLIISLAAKGRRKQVRMLEDWTTAATDDPISSRNKDCKKLYNLPQKGEVCLVQVLTSMFLSFILDTLRDSINLRALGIQILRMRMIMTSESRTRSRPREVSP